MEFEWVIVGGGIHGVHIAARLVGEVRISPEVVRIVDPGDCLLERWRTCTETTGMKHLRSPSVHHIGLDPYALLSFAGDPSHPDPKLFTAPYQQPSLSLFNAHCDSVIHTYGLSDLHIQGRAVACTVDADGVRVELSSGSVLASRNVVFAISAGEQPMWPEWAPRGDDRIQHIFQAGFDAWPLSDTSETVLVVGGGISAGMVALHLADEGHRVHMVSRHPLRVHQFDTDPGWVGPKYMDGFRLIADVDHRREVITEARQNGSVSPDIAGRLRCAMESGHLCWHEGEVEELHRIDSLCLQLSDGTLVAPDCVLLATGFVAHRPGGEMVDALVQAAKLPCASCGYPIVDTKLCWHPHIYVAGALAELELGPSARNITGARKAGDRLVEAIRMGSTL